jgi:signal transduction histidine kinase
VTLRTRLDLSHLFVIGLFASVFIMIVMLMTGGMGPSRKAMNTRDRIFEKAEGATSLGALRQFIGALNLPPSFDVAVRLPDGKREILSSTVHQGRIQGFMEMVPLNGGELRGSTLEVAAFRPPPRPGTMWNPLRDLLIAASLAGLGCLGAAMVVSRFVSRPLAVLVEAVERFDGRPLAERMQTSGPSEIKELAESFNEMASRLSVTIEELRLRKEEAERSESSRRQFLGEVSHNLRTPLSAILGWTESLLDGMGKGNERSYLKRIRRETRYVATTIGRLLDLSRWERAQPMLHMETFALSEVLLETAENLEEAAAEKGIELNLDLAEESCWVQADRHRLRDLFQILLENVVEHAGQGVRVEVSVRRDEGRYWVTVADNGKGLPESLRCGWRGEPIVVATGRASLGLAIAYHLARAHAGELSLSAGLHGLGTQATFSLPRAAPTTAPLG